MLEQILKRMAAGALLPVPAQQLTADLVALGLDLKCGLEGRFRHKTPFNKKAEEGCASAMDPLFQGRVLIFLTGKLVVDKAPQGDACAYDGRDRRHPTDQMLCDGIPAVVVLVILIVLIACSCTWLAYPGRLSSGQVPAAAVPAQTLSGHPAYASYPVPARRAQARPAVRTAA